MAKTRTPIGNEDVNFVRCTRCKFPCKLDRDKQRPGNGNVYSTLSGVVSQTQYPDDWVVTFGCPQCGRGEYATK